MAVSAEVDGGGADQVKRHAKHGVAITTGTGAWREIKTVMFVSGLEVKKKKRVK